MPTCLKCKTYNNPGNVHCKNCEAILPVEGENKCPKCATANGPFAKQCKKCGVSMANSKIVTVQFGQQEAKEESSTNTSNTVNLSSYKKKRAIKKVQANTKGFLVDKGILRKLVIAILIILCIVGVVGSLR